MRPGMVVRVYVAFSVSDHCCPTIATAAKMEGDGGTGPLPDRRPRPGHGGGDRVRLGRLSQEQGGVGQVIGGFGHPHIREGLGRRSRHRKRPTVSHADVLGCKNHQPPGDELRILATLEHEKQPVQGSVWIRTAHALDKSGDHVVVTVSRLVVSNYPLTQRFGDVIGLDDSGSPSLGQMRRDLQGRSAVPGRHPPALVTSASRASPAIRRSSSPKSSSPLRQRPVPPAPPAPRRGSCECGTTPSGSSADC